MIDPYVNFIRTDENGVIVEAQTTDWMAFNQTKRARPDAVFHETPRPMQLYLRWTYDPETGEATPPASNE